MQIEYSFYQVKRAICFFNNKSCNVNHGFCTLTQYPDKTVVQLELKNLPPGTHGFHVHEFADPRNNLINLGSHYNPYNRNHGALNDIDNHVGDLGNIEVMQDGSCNDVIYVNYLPLQGDFSVIGRSMVVHAHADDMGTHDNTESRSSGCSGERIAYGVIGHMKN